MTTLRIVLDPIVDRSTAAARYADRVVRALIAAAPEGSGVAGILAALPDEIALDVEGSYPGLRSLHRTRLGRRELRAAWQHGITVMPGEGILHATDLTAPLGRHDRRAAPGSQVVVTFPDATAWTDPASLDAREVSRRRAMGRRAARYADAVVVPSRAVGDAVDQALALGDRIRVIAGAPRPGLADAVWAGASPELPDSYALVVLADAEPPGNEVDELSERLPDGMHLVVVGDGTPREQPHATRTTFLDGLDGPALGATIAGAGALIHPRGDIGFGLAALDAMSVGTPVVYVEAADGRELLADGALAVDASDATSGIAAAVAALTEDPELRERMTTLGRDRAHAFTWLDAAEKIWQLHADL